MKHTPGPWKYNKHEGSSYFADIEGTYGKDERGYHNIRTIGVITTFAGAFESEANAKLIAAAPELLEALKEGITAAKHSLDEMSFRGSNKEGFAWKRIEGFILQAEAAIKRAND